jgi:hypothetical protein
MKPAILMCLYFLLSSGTGNAAEEMVDLYLKEARKQLVENSARAAAKDNLCYRCGVCCQELPCRHGQWDLMRHQCIHLLVDVKTPEYTTFRCERYAEIIHKEEGKPLPIFGDGCTNYLYNEARERIRRAGKNNQTF